MGTTIAIVVGLAACGGEEAPSCQQAIDHFYGAGCTFYDTSTTPPTATPQGTALNLCSQINVQIPERCRGEFDDWKFCLDSVAGGTNESCASCSQEMDALFACD